MIIEKLRTLQMDYESKLFDWWNGVYTHGLWPVKADAPDCNVSKEEIVAYRPSHSRSLAKIFSKQENLDKQVFVDIGCGRGRALLTAAKFPFKKLVGIDIDSKNCKLSELHLRTKSTTPAVILHGDATNLRLPDEGTFYYLARPFNSHSSQADFFEGLKASYWRNQREIYVLFYGENPEFKKELFPELIAKPLKPARYQKSYSFYQFSPEDPKVCG